MGIERLFSLSGQAALVTGGGAGSYNVLLERFRPENFPDDAQWAHNDYLNTLSDFAHTDTGVTCDAYEHVGVVSEEGPCGHGRKGSGCYQG